MQEIELRITVEEILSGIGNRIVQLQRKSDRRGSGALKSKRTITVVSLWLPRCIGDQDVAVVIANQLVVACVRSQACITANRLNPPAETGARKRYEQRSYTGVGRNNGFCWKIESPFGLRHRRNDRRCRIDHDVQRLRRRDIAGNIFRSDKQTSDAIFANRGYQLW